MIKQRFELSEEEIRLIALYRKKQLTEAKHEQNEILNIKESMEFIDNFNILIEAEKEMKINSKLIYRYLFRVLSLFNERCNFFGLDGRSHVIDILDQIDRVVPSSNKIPNRPNIN
tara:strand:+ start:2214 stop:2558 length:345 start_codon:yes stop_codon:yes gene_type:complete